MTAAGWFERLFGFAEVDAATVHQALEVAGPVLRTRAGDQQWVCGRLEVVDLASLRERAAETIVAWTGQPLRVSECVGDARALHADPQQAGALFQVASQFNLLEMISPHVTPEQGIGIYASDPTQGPACAVACAAGTVYRNYFVPLADQVGQTADRQIDCLAAIGQWLGNQDNELWRMQNGYALPSATGLRAVDRRLAELTTEQRDLLRGRLQIGLQWNTQVTLPGCQHLVSQAYCSALPVAYSSLPARDWEGFARLVLEAAYEATLAAAVLNAATTGNPNVFLTLLGGGAFGNEPTWILDAIARALTLYAAAELHVQIVSYRSSNPSVKQLTARYP